MGELRRRLVGLRSSSGRSVSIASGVLVLVFLVAACREGVPVIDTAPKPRVARGTIAGSVRGPEGTSPLSGRTVEAVNIETGDRATVLTSATGTFTLQLPPGKYRLELALRPGESLLKKPDVVDLTKGDIDANLEFVVSPARAWHQRGPRYRLDNGLGAPIA